MDHAPLPLSFFLPEILLLHEPRRLRDLKVP
jgi:hypothetical protein